jgi:hypothetical protein
MIRGHGDRIPTAAKLALGLLASSLVLACFAVIALLSARPGSTLGVLLGPTSTPSPTPTFAPTFTATPIPEPTATLAPSPTPSPVEPQPHQWLARPFGGEYNVEPTSYYPYGSTAGGRYRVHRGNDFPNPFGTPVFAPAKGRVIVAGDDQRVIHGERVGFYGQLVIIQLEEKYRGEKVYVLYGHLSKLHVRFLQEINEGDLIGEVGMTGVAIGPHLHLEVRVGRNSYANTRNPQLWLRPLPGSGTLAGTVVDEHGQPVPTQNLTVYRAESPDQRWRDTVSYSQSEVNSDEEWRENFVMADVPAGSYVIKTYLNGKLLGKDFTISDGEVARVTMQATETESS